MGLVEVVEVGEVVVEAEEAGVAAGKPEFVLEVAVAAEQGELAIIGMMEQ